MRTLSPHNRERGVAIIAVVTAVAIIAANDDALAAQFHRELRRRGLMAPSFRLSVS